MITVIVTTFERPSALLLSLAALERQRDCGEFEIIVADDGSSDATESIVREHALAIGGVLSFVTQEHKGFRLAQLRNLAVRSARGDYLVFLDGDCVPHDDFVAGHELVRQPRRFAVGGRCYLGRAPSEALRVEQVRKLGIAPFVPAKERRRLRRVRRRDWIYNALGWKNRPKMIGANFAVHRSDYVAVNGFDNRYVGWGFEDEDFARRLERMGIRRVSAVGEAKAVHIWHEPVPSFHGRARDSDNAERYRSRHYLTRPLHGLQRRSLSDLSFYVAPELRSAFPAADGAAGRSAEVAIHYEHVDHEVEAQFHVLVVRARPAALPLFDGLIVEAGDDDGRTSERVRLALEEAL